MQDFEKLGSFYLGRLFDLDTRSRKEDLLLYDSRDLVTHAVCVGMTGSGKTGLCLSLLEEAAMDGIPALIIDPKGDLPNLLLTFPELRPADFRPWINEDDARRKGQDADTFAAAQAAMWKKGLEEWGQTGARIATMRSRCELSIYTPGSDAGIPISVLKSFDAPPKELMEDRELYRDRVMATASGLLGLLDIDADPIQSREHILISNLLDAAWRQGKAMDLPALIQQIQAPPMSKIGVLDLESFFASKERFKLAMRVNNLLASPGFEAWMSGEPLDVQSLLYTPQGKPRLSIVSIAHLSDSERMFFVSLLLNQTLSWMRQQSGTTSLRAVLYMDEIFGYFPPNGEPPSKRPLLTLLKQARAFGLGVVLATQNPVDLDYKGLSNTGTWFIGRLQTERDKNRVLDGLEGASANAGGSFDRQQMDGALSSLTNRVFLLNNVHGGAPVVFETRWAMSYLRGPMTRTQIRELMAHRADAAEAPVVAAAPAAVVAASATRPVLPPEIRQYFVPARAASGAGVTYAAKLFGEATVRFSDAKKGVDITKTVTVLAPITADAIAVNWEAAEAAEVTANELEAEPLEGAAFCDAPAAAAKAKSYAAWSKEFLNWVFATQTVDLLQCASLGELSKPEENERDFRARLQLRARECRDADLDAIRTRYASKRAALEERVRRAEQAVQRQKSESQAATLSNALSIGSGLLGAFLGSRKTSTAITKAVTAARGVSRIRKESQDVGLAEENVAALRQQYADLEAEIQQQIDAVASAANPADEAFETVSVRPKKTNISVRLCTLAWKAELL